MLIFLTQRPVLALLLAAVCVAGAPAVARAGKPLQVVTTTTDLRSLAEFVGGDHVSVTSIGTGREDVHMIAAKPSFMVQANRADLWIRMGLELEIGFEPLVLEGARNPNIFPGRLGPLDASLGIVPLNVPVTPVDRSMGDVHPQGDPHYHLDPCNAVIMARNIRDRLITLDPANRSAYEANYESFVKQLTRAMFGGTLAATHNAENLWGLHTEGRLDAMLAEQGTAAEGWHGLLKPYRGKRLVTYHKSWAYFAHRFGLDIVDELEPKPGIPPTSRHLAALAARMKALDVRLILMEPFYSRKAPDLLAARTDAIVVEAGNMVGAMPEATDYIAMMDAIVRRVADALARAY